VAAAYVSGVTRSPPSLPASDRLRGYAVAGAIAARALSLRRRRRSLAQRLAELPATAPAAADIRIAWSDHAIPFVQAASEADLAVGLGIVHAHLRLGQMELMRRIAQGRVSEFLGPLGIELDRTLRLLGFDRAVPAIVEGLAPDTRAWAEGFVRGINHVLATARLPEEMQVLGIGREPWTLRCLFTSARLAGADVSWLVYGRLLRARARLPHATWRALWPLLLGAGMPPLPGAPEGLLARAGSNAAAVAARRSTSGGALLAADPHLSVALPNVWLACGMACPGLNAVGLMPTGFPIVAIGRNRHLAWGGTSLHAAASDLFDVSRLPLTQRTQALQVRGVGRRTLVLRESPLGPVVSDGRMFSNPAPLALRWVGHLPSDEMGAMLRVMRATDGAGFAAALAGFAIPGQTMVFAAADGSVGRLPALRAPRRAGLPADLVLPPEAAAAWDSLAGTAEFCGETDPADGVIVSANEPPPPQKVPPGFFYSPLTRADRLRALLVGCPASVDLDTMARTQTDVLGRQDVLAALLPHLPHDHPGTALLRLWDGGYDAASRGALVFEATMAELSRLLPDQASLVPLTAVWTGRQLLAQRALALDEASLRPMLARALDAAMRTLRRHGTWGALHRMRLRHYFGGIPVLGRRYRWGDYPSPGGNDTLNKAGHGPALGRHPVTYGASARFLADLAKPDRNRVVLLGGQDGDPGSANFLDQVGLWRRGAYLDLPLRPESVRAWPHQTVLRAA
jgi:penicillin amidase